MKLIANTEDRINWNSVILKCLESKGTTMIYDPSCFPDTQEFRYLDELWQQAGYKYQDNNIEWINYFKEDFGLDVVDTFENIVDVRPLMVWVSRIRPGKMAPWHFDAHKDIEHFKQKGELIRFTCYIQDPQHGHVSIVDNETVYRPAKGNIYQWPKYDAWHCGMNGGLTDKFMFNYWGYR